MALNYHELISQSYLFHKPRILSSFCIIMKRKYSAEEAGDIYLKKTFIFWRFSTKFYFWNESLKVLRHFKTNFNGNVENWSEEYQNQNRCSRVWEVGLEALISKTIILHYFEDIDLLSLSVSPTKLLIFSQ